MHSETTADEDWPAEAQGCQGRAQCVLGALRPATASNARQAGWDACLVRRAHWPGVPRRVVRRRSAAGKVQPWFTPPAYFGYQQRLSSRVGPPRPAQASSRPVARLPIDDNQTIPFHPRRAVRAPRRSIEIEPMHPLL